MSFSRMYLDICVCSPFGLELATCLLARVRYKSAMEPNS